MQELLCKIKNAEQYGYTAGSGLESVCCAVALLYLLFGEGNLGNQMLPDVCKSNCGHKESLRVHGIFINFPHRFLNEQ